MNSPPNFFLSFFRWFCHKDLKKYIEGDLIELYDERVKKLGRRKADLKFMIEVVLLFRPGIIKPINEYDHLNQYAMYGNYFKVGFRNILKYKMFSFINVFGLALAMSVCMLIILMVADQKNYDQFHVNGDRIYRILTDGENFKVPSATTPYPLASILKTDYSIVEESTQLTRGVGGEATYNKRTTEMRGYFADASFFKVFSYELVRGNKNTALTSPNSMVITSDLAKQLFNNEDPVGKAVAFVDMGLSNLGTEAGSKQIAWGLYTVTGVIESEKYRSHLKFNVLLSASSRVALHQESKVEDMTNNWWNNQSYTYVVLQPGKGQDEITSSLNDLVLHKKDELKEQKGFQLIAQKLSEITPGILVSNESSCTLPKFIYYFLALLATVIMISACLNYTNLSTARALTRAKEIGVRKVTGAFRTNLVYQFLSESVATALLSLIMAGVILVFLKPAFQGLWINKYLNFELQGNLYVYIIFIAFALFIGIGAGLYPALYLSKYQPIKALKNTETLNSRKLSMRKILSVSQFVVSLFFITTSILIFKQFKHFVEFDYGFNTNNIVNIPLQGNDYHKVLNELNTVAGVSSISACDYVPSTGINNTISVKPLQALESKDEYKRLTILMTDENFVDNLDIKLIAGKHFEATDSSNRFIIVNEAAVKEFGFQYPSEIIGKTFEADWNKEPLEVIGVVENFRVKLPLGEDKISPMMLKNEPHSFNYVNVKIASTDLAGTLGKLKDKWNSIDAAHAFKYEFYDAELAAMNQGLFDVVSILGFIAFLAITIACLGMLGMATYTAERKKKEVGIRKILGAAEIKIAVLLSQEFFKVLAIAIFVGAPLSYYVNNLWLQNFPNRVEFGINIIALGVLILVSLGLLTIGSQTVKASKDNPVNSLKSE